MTLMQEKLNVYVKCSVIISNMKSSMVAMVMPKLYNASSL